MIPDFDSAGSWAKKFFFASRALMESALRPFGLGNTQWYVLYRLVHQDSISQRDLVLELEVERATLSAVISSLVRKRLIVQQTDRVDQRQKSLAITDAGRSLWNTLPDPVTILREIAFADVDPDDLATTKRVLTEATGRLVSYRKESTKS
jgi:DNA-binding MarR family transcriptional regulator